MSTTGAIGQQLKLRLFLEGIEVPVIGAQVQMNLNAPATSSIQVIPVDSVLELKPRTMVHLFYWDFNYDLPPNPENQTGSSSVNTDALDPDVQLDNYKLLFGGEVVGLSWAKNPLGRQAVLQCADWSTYWDTSYQTFISYSPNGNWLGSNSAMWSGGNSMFHNLLSSHSSVMSQFLRRRPKTEGLQNVQGLMGGIISLLEAMGGVTEHISGINDYFTIAEIKNHLLQQITADQTDNTALRLFSANAFSAWLNRRTSSLGELVSFRDMLKLLFHWIYYEVVPVTSPKFVAANLPEITKKRVAFTAGSISASTVKSLSYWVSLSTKVDGSGGVDLALLKQLTLNDISGGENAVARVMKDGLTRTIKVDTSLDGRTVRFIKKAINATSDIIFIDRSGISSFAIAPAVSLNIKEAETTSGPKNVALVKSRLIKNQIVWRRITRYLTLSLNSGKRTRRAHTVIKKKAATLDRLQTQIFRPDCFFVAPPKCNVLFPDQITQFQYQRNFLQEITRLRLTTGTMFTSGRGGGFFQNAHMAPDIAEIKRIARSQGNRGIRTLLPWEIFTGILPKFEHISEVNYISNRASRKRRTVSKDLRGKGKAYAQRAANFNFLKYRFAPRGISVTAKFSPQFTLGFPALIIDKPFILDPSVIKAGLIQAGVTGKVEFSVGSLLANIDKLAVVFKSPVQYLGMPAGVAHSVDQSGGVTRANLTHARIHKITDDDYLSNLLVEVKRGLNKTLKRTELDAEDLLAKGDYKNLNLLIRCTPQASILSRIKQIRRGENPDPVQTVASLEDENKISSRPTSAQTALDQVVSVLPRINSAGILRGRIIKVTSFLSNDLETTIEGTAGQDAGSAGTRFITITGGTTETPFQGGTIKEPSPYGPLGKGKRGPKGGIIKHVQVVTNGVLSVSSADINGFARSRRDKKALRKRKRRGGDPDTFFLWRKVILHEEVTSNKTVREIPIEEAMRPPWFSPQYSNLFIGDSIYQNFFGTGSVVDQSLFITPTGAAFFGNSDVSNETRKDLFAKVQAADGDLTSILRILDDFKARGVGTMPSIEASVDSLAFLYGEVRRQNLNVQQFVADYTNRPIATMRNIFGSLDLEYGIDSDGTLTKLRGDAGFHSTAVAPFGDLLGLVDNPDLEIPRIRRRGKKFPISRALDPRPGRREKVQAYADQVGSSGDSLGIGLLG